MKCLINLMITCLFCLSVVAQTTPEVKAVNYSVIKAEGLSEDIRSVFVTFSKEMFSSIDRIVLSYYARFGDVYVKADSILIGHYNVTKEKDSIFIDNFFLPNREYLSMMNTLERKYRVAIVSQKKDTVVLKINNGGNETKLNLLENEVTLTLKRLSK